MPTFSTDSEPPIESDLPDLSTIPFAALRNLNAPALHNAMHQVVQRAGQVRITSRSGSSGSGERID